MQTLLEAANHIAQEIERTRLHLANLEQALEGLRPLITIEAQTTTLSYNVSPEDHPVEDASIVSAKEPTSKPRQPQKARAGKVATPEKSQADKQQAVTPVVTKSKRKTQAQERSDEVMASSTNVPATGTEFWMTCIGRKAFSVGDLTGSAVEKLGLDDTAKTVIANRARAWVTAALKQGVVLPVAKRDGINVYKRA